MKTRNVSLGVLLAALYLPIGVHAVDTNLHRCAWNGSAWTTSTIIHDNASVTNPKAYTVVAAFRGAPGQFLAARPGGLDYFDNMSSPQVKTISTATYTAIEEDISTTTRRFYGVRAGGLDEIYYGGAGWVITPINANTYTAVARDIISLVVYGARAGGGLDKMVKSGSTWTTYPVKAGQGGAATTKVYRSIVRDSLYGHILYAAAADSLDYVYHGTDINDMYVAQTVNSNAYTALAPVSSTVFGRIAAARLGSLDNITYNSGWTTGSFRTDTYLDLAPDRNLSGRLYAARMGSLDYFQGSVYQGAINANTYTDIEEEGGTGTSILGVYACQRSVKDAQFNGGAKGDNAADDTAAIQACIDNVNTSGGGIVYFPAGTYKVSLSGSNPNRLALRVYKNITLQGLAMDNATIRLADPTGGNYNYLTVIGGSPSSDNLTNFKMFDLTVDCNGPNYPVQSVSDFQNGARFAICLYVGGGHRIQRCRFKNARDVNVLTINNLMFDTVISDCRFEGTGGGSVDFDHSSIYLCGHDAQIYNCNFNTAAGAGTKGAATAIEIHCSNINVHHDNITGYGCGINATGIQNVPTPSDNQTYAYNTIRECKNGVVIWSMYYYYYGTWYPAPPLPALTNCRITNNTIAVNVDAWYPLYPYRCSGISLVESYELPYAPIQNLAIEDNSISFDNMTQTRGSYVDFYSAGIKCLNGSTSFLDNISQSGGVWTTRPIVDTQGKLLMGTAMAHDPADGTVVYAARAGGVLARIVNGIQTYSASGFPSYTKLEEDATAAGTFYGITGGLLEKIAWNGSSFQRTTIDNLTTGSYTGVTRDVLSGIVYATVSTGGINAWVYSGAWTKYPIRAAWGSRTTDTTVYQTLVRDNYYSGVVYASASGKLNYLYPDNASRPYDLCVAAQINGNTYTALAPASSTMFGRVAATRSGSLDNITYISPNWVTGSFGANTYADLAADGAASGTLYAARSAGGLDWFQNFTAQTQINGCIYTDLEEAANANHLYGIRSAMAPLTTPLVSGLSIQRNSITNAPGPGVYLYLAPNKLKDATVNQNVITNPGSGSNPACVYGMIVAGKTDNITIQSDNFTDTRIPHVTGYCVDVVQSAGDVTGAAVTGGHSVTIADGTNIHHVLPYSPTPAGWMVNACTGNVINP